jgi:transcriptional regulator with XRE-family HTH domain
MFDMKIGEKIQKLIEDRGTSQAELGRKVKIAQPRLNVVINGKARLFVDQAAAVAKALDVSLDYLADESLGEPLPPAMTEWERKVWEIVSAIGPEMAWRRLIGEGVAKGPLIVDTASDDPASEVRPTKDRRRTG